MTPNGATSRVGCTGSKVGPRAVLTASHCIMDANGNMLTSGRFNPGQTSTSSGANGSHDWTGVLLQDWRDGSGGYNEFDYAVFYVDDSSQFYGLGWLGVAWWNSASSYTGKTVKLRGYPCGINANANCGLASTQQCAASPRSDKACDGWMYNHSRTLTSSSYVSSSVLEFLNDGSKGQSGSSIVYNLGAVSYTHLTLPTIYSV